VTTKSDLARELAAVKLTPVDPIGTQRTWAFVNPGGLEEIEMAVYPEATRVEGERLRVARVEMGIGLREASKRLGLSAVDLSRVERGAMTCDIDEVIRILRAAQESQQ
jgi:hypothetical protein